MRIVIQRNCIYLVIFLNQTCHQDVIKSNQNSPKLKSPSLSPSPFSVPFQCHLSPMPLQFCHCLLHRCSYAHQQCHSLPSYLSSLMSSSLSWSPLVSCLSSFHQPYSLISSHRYARLVDLCPIAFFLLAIYSILIWTDTQHANPYICCLVQLWFDLVH